MKRVFQLIADYGLPAVTFGFIATAVWMLWRYV